MYSLRDISAYIVGLRRGRSHSEATPVHAQQEASCGARAHRAAASRMIVAVRSSSIVGTVPTREPAALETARGADGMKAVAAARSMVGMDGIAVPRK